MTIPKIWKRITFLSVLTLITNSYTAAKEIINIPLQNGDVTMNIRKAIESAKTDDIKIILEKEHISASRTMLQKNTVQ